MIRHGKHRGEKWRYENGIFCTIWRVFPGAEPGSRDEDFGPCFDFDFEDLDDIIAILEELRDAPVEEE